MAKAFKCDGCRMYFDGEAPITVHLEIHGPKRNLPTLCSAAVHSEECIPLFLRNTADGMDLILERKAVKNGA